MNSSVPRTLMASTPNRQHQLGLAAHFELWSGFVMDLHTPAHVAQWVVSRSGLAVRH